MSTRFSVGQQDYIFQLNALDDLIVTKASLSGATFTGAITATAFNGNATSATNATNSTNVGVTNDTATNTTYFPAMMAVTTGNGIVRVSNTKLTFNPSTGALFSTQVTGNLIRCNSTSAIGYSTGAGGTVVQATSKSTGVTLSKAFGDITMTADSLAADTSVSFVLTNTAIVATDTLVLNHQSGGTAGSYTLNAQCGAGVATITVRNVTPAALAEAIVIRFALIKGVLA